MASRIQGITVEIGGDTTKLQTALKGVNGSIKSTQQQLKDVNSLLKLDPGNTELLAQKQKELVRMAQAKKDYRRWRMRLMTFGNRDIRSWLKRPGLKVGRNG